MFTWALSPGLLLFRPKGNVSEESNPQRLSRMGSNGSSTLVGELSRLSRLGCRMSDCDVKELLEVALRENRWHRVLAGTMAASSSINPSLALLNCRICDLVANASM